MKILFIHPFGIGDVIFSLAAAEALSRRGHVIDYLCNERTEEFLRLCPIVRKTHQFDRAGLRDQIKSGNIFKAAGRYCVLRRTLAVEAYDAVLDFSMGREYAFLAWCAGIRRRAGWDYKSRGRWLTDRVKVKSFDERSPRDFGMDLARKVDPQAAVQPTYPKLNLADEKIWLDRKMGPGPWIVIAPGGGESWGRDAHYKQWPQESWVQLARILMRETRTKIAVIGSRAEETLVRAVAAAAEPHSASSVTAVVGEPLRKVLALLAGARAFVGTDGGLLHLANVAGTPAVGIYGPVSDQGYSPLESAGPYRIVTANVPCRPCYKQFRFTGCAFEKRCLTQIRSDRVAAEVRSLLAPEPL